MADIAKAAGLDANELILPAASKLFSYLWDEAWQNAPGTLEGDADALHDMRVAVRRLRTAMQNFEGPKDASLLPVYLQKELKDYRRKLGKLGDALGAVRDFDVLADALKDYQKEHQDTKTDGLDTLKTYLRSQREAAFPKMVKRIQKTSKLGGLKEEFARFTLGLPAADVQPLLLGGAGQVVVRWRVDEVLRCASMLEDQENAIGHHEFRKSLRRLRYTLEALSPCLSEPAEPHIDTLTQLQDYLGEMQDLHVLHVATHAAFGSAGSRSHSSSGHKVDESDLPGDVRAFLAYGAQRQDELLQQARDLWQEQQKKQWPEVLRAMVENVHSL